MHTIEEDIVVSEEIAQKVREKGGHVFYVGGHVRDEILGKENKDIDLEVHDISEKELKRTLSECGRLQEYGKSFGIYSLNHYGVDIALPVNSRGERDPYVPITEALGRRDFTMNAMAEDVLTHEIIDPFHGQKDIADHVIRVVNDHVFDDDPLRVFRLSSFYARTQFLIERHAEELAMHADVNALPKERIYAETVKALMKSERPSLFFMELRKIRKLTPWFQEVYDLIDVPQSPEHHPEGDVFNHTMMVLDNGAFVKNRSMHPLEFMLACLCHDFGKTVSTTISDGKIISYHHEDTGVPLAATFLKRLTDNRELIHYVKNMVQLHMRPNNLASSIHRGEKVGLKATNSLFDVSVCPNDLILLSWCDQAGRVDEKVIGDNQKWLWERLSVYEETVKQVIDGRDLIKLGYKPGKGYKEALSFARKQTLSMVPRETVLKRTDDYMKSLEKTKNIRKKDKGDNHE